MPFIIALRTPIGESRATEEDPARPLYDRGWQWTPDVEVAVANTLNAAFGAAQMMAFNVGRFAIDDDDFTRNEKLIQRNARLTLPDLHLIEIQEFTFWDIAQMIDSPTITNNLLDEFMEVQRAREHDFSS